MLKDKIRQLIDHRASQEGLTETGIQGVSLFKVTEPVRCAPAVYEPCIVAIVSGTKEAIIDGTRHEYDHEQYLCCSVSMPVEAGTPHASLDNPLLGVYISLDTRVLTELSIAMENAESAIHKPKAGALPPAFALSKWDGDFAEALFRLLQLGHSPTDTAVLGNARLRELYYTVLKGEAGDSMRRAFGVGNEIARAIDYLASNLHAAVNIEEMASKVGMSRAVLHRKFKQATTMSPMQFVKSMRLNTAAMHIASGETVQQAALDVGYVSTSQFSREFKRLFGHSPKQWRTSNDAATGRAL